METLHGFELRWCYTDAFCPVCDLEIILEFNMETRCGNSCDTYFITCSQSVFYILYTLDFLFCNSYIELIFSFPLY